MVGSLLTFSELTGARSALAEAARVALLATLFVDQRRIAALRAKVSLHRARRGSRRGDNRRHWGHRLHGVTGFVTVRCVSSEEFGQNLRHRIRKRPHPVPPDAQLAPAANAA